MQFPPISTTNNKFHLRSNTDAQSALRLGFLYIIEPCAKPAQRIYENIRIKHGQTIRSDAICVPTLHYLSCLPDPSTCRPRGLLVKELGKDAHAVFLPRD